MVGEPWGRRALILYINCTVTERAAGGCRASLKLMVQLDAAEEGLDTMMAPLGEAAGEAGDLLIEKAFPERAGLGCGLQLLSGCALNWLYKPSLLDHFE